MSKNQFNLLLTGDSIIARNLSTYGEESIDEIIKVIKEADIAFTNLEILPNDFKGYPAARSDGAHFATNSSILDELKKMGFNLFSCANNHALDYGIEGLIETMEQLDKRNISYSGIGKSLTEARMPTYMGFKKSSTAMLACSSTFFEEQSAGEQRPEVQGRPGINPLRFETTYEVKTEQFNSLKSIAHDLGIEQQRQEFIELGFASKTTDLSLFPLVDTNLRATTPLNALFKESKVTRVRTTPNKRDLEDICKWVRESKSRSQHTVVSIHAHEQGETREHPAEFIKSFTHRVVDEGADVVVGHGPHLLRGMEIYKGRPIFYSLGNFIGQNEMIYKLPADSYSRFDIDPSLTPSEVFSIRSEDGRKGFPGDPIYWITIMPICKYVNGEIDRIRILPVKITRGDKPYKRGTPFIAKGQDAKDIINHFSSLSQEYGTSISYQDGEGIIEMK